MPKYIAPSAEKGSWLIPMPFKRAIGEI